MHTHVSWGCKSMCSSPLRNFTSAKPLGQCTSIQMCVHVVTVTLAVYMWQGWHTCSSVLMYPPIVLHLYLHL